MSPRFQAQHRSMIDVAERILAVAEAAGPDGPARLGKLRLTLSREVSEHCGAEVSLLNQRGAPEDAGSASLVRRYHDDLLRWRHDLIACNSDWPPRRVFQRPAEFRRAFEPIVARLRERVRWEEQVFYPAVLHAGVNPSAAR